MDPRLRGDDTGEKEKTMSKILVFGAGGQIGSALVGYLGENAIAYDRDQADFLNPETLTDAIVEHQPLAVINAAAYTAVDKAESEPELADAINHIAVGKIAEACKEMHVPLVHYSTDYVYPGTGDKPWTETDATGPLNTYGKTKLAGEEAIRAAGCDHFIFRTSWVYDAHGSNFVNTMLKLGAEREGLNIVNDQSGAPSFAPHLAIATLQALEKSISRSEFPTGIYHLCNNGVTTWYTFALEIFKHARKAGVELKVNKVEGIPASAYPTPAKRPHNSRLNARKFRDTFGIRMPDWKEGLAGYFQHMSHCHHH